MSSIEDWSSIEYSRPLDTSTLGSQKLLRSTVVKFPNRGRNVWPTRNNKNIIVKMNFHNPTATDNFTFLDTLTGAVTRSSFLTSQCPPPKNTPLLPQFLGGLLLRICQQQKSTLLLVSSISLVTPRQLRIAALGPTQGRNTCAA